MRPFAALPHRAIRSVALHRDLPTTPGNSTRALAFGLSFSSLALALRAETDQPTLPPSPGTPPPDQLGEPRPAPAAPTPAPARGRGELFFIDAAVADPHAFWLAATVVAIPADVDSWQFMAAEAARFHDLGAIHLVSHGEPGALVLNGRRTTAADLTSRAALLRRLGAALSKNGDFLLYGCDTGSGDAGRLLVTRLADFTGSDVAASANPTGARPGADWNLEITRGTIETPLAAPADYAYTLHTASVATIAQLKAAIATASTDNAADIITITANITFASAADAITINVTDDQTLSISGGGFTLSGGNLARVLDITAGNVAISNLTITNGKLSGNGGAAGAGGAGVSSLGAGIRNAGILTITSSTITANKASGGGGGTNTHTNYAGGGGGGFGSGNGGAGGNGAPGGAYAAASAASGITGGKGGGGAAGSAGKGGSSTAGAGATYSGSGYTVGGNGAVANNGTISIGGGGTGARGTGGAGGSAAGGIYNTGTITILTSTISNNIGAAGGGGGGGSAYFSNTGNGGAGGAGIGAIWNRGGTARLDALSFATLATGNAAGGGLGGFATGGTNTSGANGTATAGLSTTNGGTQNPADVVADTTPPTVVSIVRQLPSAAQSLTAGTTSATFRVTFSVTFSEAFNAPVTSNFAVTAVNSSTIVGTIASVAAVSSSVYDVAVTLTAGTGEFRLKVLD